MSTPSHPIAECASKLNHLARENPRSTLLAAIGCGLAIGFLVRTLIPRTPASRTARLLADMSHRLHAIAVPVRRETKHLVEASTSAVKSGVEHLHDLHLGRGLKKLGQRLKGIFS
jgi:hypothetical protein